MTAFPVLPPVRFCNATTHLKIDQKASEQDFRISANSLRFLHPSTTRTGSSCFGRFTTRISPLPAPPTPPPLPTLALDAPLSQDLANNLIRNLEPAALADPITRQARLASDDGAYVPSVAVRVRERPARARFRLAVDLCAQVAFRRVHGLGWDLEFLCDVRGAFALEEFADDDAP